jgi:hypothetical protein
MLAYEWKSLKKSRTWCGEFSCAYCVAPQRTQSTQRTAENYFTTGDTGDTGRTVARTARTANARSSLHSPDSRTIRRAPPRATTQLRHQPLQHPKARTETPRGISTIHDLPSTISHKQNAPVFGPGRSVYAPCRNRTYNLVIKSHLLCQLS